MKKLIFKLIEQEKQRQETNINLIASENYASLDIMAVAGSVLTNKYAEGYPDRRYYGGCQVIDQIEDYARDLGKKLFGAEHINVQPHSGSSANFAVYFGLLKPGDTILGMNLGAGGHLTHGHKINFSGSLFNFVHYGVNRETEQIDYDEIALLAEQHKPKMIVAGASAYSRIIDFEEIKEIAQNIEALLFVDMAHIAGLVAANIIPSPIPVADIVSSTTHKTLRGPRGGLICCKQQHAQTIDRAVMPGSQGGPLMHIIGAKAVAFEEALQPTFKVYQQQVVDNAKAMAQEFKNLGYRVVSGGTDTHLFLIDLQSKTFRGEALSGKDAEQTLGKCNIVLNRNMVPFDTKSPLITSGIRIGTSAISTRGMGKNESDAIVQLIDQALNNHKNTTSLVGVKKQVEQLGAQFPVYS